MEDLDRHHQMIKEAVLAKFTARVAYALAQRDCAQSDMEMPKEDHKLWSVWNDSAEVVVEELRQELSAFIDYDNTINWMTTCTQCAVTLESSYRETVRRELVELTLKEVAEWAHNTRHGHAAGEVLKILEKGAQRLGKAMEEK